MNFLNKIFKPSQIAKKQIPLVTLRGVLSPSTGNQIPRRDLNLESVDNNLVKAFSFQKSDSVFIAINSPGGSPVQSSFIFKRIRQLAEENKKKVFAFVEDVAASGGYYIACAGDEIYADESSIVGSIGVITSTFGFPELLKRIGVERRVITQGKNKSFFDPFQELDEKSVNLIKEIQTPMFNRFKEVVVASRGSKLKNPEENEIFTGKVFVGNNAKELGLIDGIATMHEIAREKYGKDVEFIKFKPPTGIRALLQGETSMENNLPNSLISSIENKFHWKRFGM